MIQRMNKLMNGWIAKRMNEWINRQFSPERSHHILCKLNNVNKWMKEWRNESMTKWIDKLSI